MQPLLKSYLYTFYIVISSAALYNRRGYFSSAFRRDCSRHRSAYGMRARKETKKCETCRRSRYEGQKKIPSHLSIATRRASDWLASLPLSLRLSRARKLGAPRRNLKKVVRLPALSFTVASKSVHERARASRRDATRASRERISEVDDHSVVAARKSPSKVARGVIEADRERQRRGERGRGEEGGKEREREHLESALVAPGHRPRCRGEPLRAGFGALLEHVPPEPRFFPIADTRRRTRTRRAWG